MKITRVGTLVISLTRLGPPVVEFCITLMIAYGVLAEEMQKRSVGRGQYVILEADRSGNMR